MDLREHVHQLLGLVSETLGLAGGGTLALDQHNECILALSEDLLFIFYLEESTQMLLINIPVAPLPPAPAREEVLMELMGANYCWSRTEGGTFGLDQDTGFICLSYPVELPLEPRDLIKTIIEKLANVVGHWRKEVPALAESWEGRSSEGNFEFPMLKV